MVLTRLILFAFAGIACTSLAIAEPQSPPSSPAVTAEEKQQLTSEKTPDSHPNEQPAVSPTKSDDTARRQIDSHGNESAPDWITLLTGVIAFTAVVQVIAMFVQARYMRQGLRLTKQAADAADASVKQAMDMARLDQRAWCAATNFFSGVPVAGQKFVIRVVVKNTGKTFARDVTTSCYLRGVRDQQMPNFAEIVEARDAVAIKVGSGSILTPNAELFGGTNGITLTQDTVNDFNAGREIFYVFGRITYSDIFDCPHWTTYCSILHPTGEYAICEKYNDADKNRAP
jgi:hypothetical protein